MTTARRRSALFLLVVASIAVFAQSSQDAAKQPPSAATATAEPPEISTQEQTPSFQVKVNLVEIRVVVRDKNGKAVGDLKKEDFVVLDDKNPQTISRFSIERSEAPTSDSPGQPLEAASPNSNPNGMRSPLARSWRLAYLFDDFNSTPNDLINARKAAEQAIDSLAPGELLGIFTLSGQGTQDFTGDKSVCVRLWTSYSFGLRARR